LSRPYCSWLCKI